MPVLDSNVVGYLVLLAIVLIVFGSLFLVLFRRLRSAIKDNNLHRSQISLSILALMLFVGTIAYRLLVWGRLEQTSALFIGLPTLLALIAVLGPKATSVNGMIMKGITISLFMSGIVLGEGFICILMSAPLFYLIGGIIGLAVSRTRNSGNSSVVNSFIIVPLIAMSFEGTLPQLSFPCSEVVTVVKEVNSSGTICSFAGCGIFDRRISYAKKLKWKLA